MYLHTFAQGVPNTTHYTSLATPCTAQPADPELTLLILNAQKARANISSLTDIITVLDQHTPDFLFLTEIPLHPHSGALTHALRNRGFSLHYHPSNAPSQPDVLPEARLHTHLTHSRGGWWLAYRKNSPCPSMVHPLILSTNCPKAIVCVVELTLLTGAKATIIACYLPQTAEEYTRACEAPARLPT